MLYVRTYISLPYSTAAGSKVQLQLAEIHKEAGQLEGLDSPPSRVCSCHARTRKGMEVEKYAKGTTYLSLNHRLAMNYLTFFTVEAVLTIPHYYGLQRMCTVEQVD